MIQNITLAMFTWVFIIALELENLLLPQEYQFMHMVILIINLITIYLCTLETGITITICLVFKWLLYMLLFNISLIQQVIPQR